MIAILSIKANGSFDVQEYFIETLNGIIYPLTVSISLRIFRDSQWWREEFDLFISVSLEWLNTTLFHEHKLLIND